MNLSALQQETSLHSEEGLSGDRNCADHNIYSTHCILPLRFPSFPACVVLNGRWVPKLLKIPFEITQNGLSVKFKLDFVLVDVKQEYMILPPLKKI